MGAAKLGLSIRRHFDMLPNVQVAALGFGRRDFSWVEGDPACCGENGSNKSGAWGWEHGEGRECRQIGMTFQRPVFHAKGAVFLARETVDCQDVAPLL